MYHFTFSYCLSFVFTKNELLAEATGEASLEGVRKLKKALLAKYLEEEQLFEEKELNALVWKQRQQYYINRYIDASRRERLSSCT